MLWTALVCMLMLALAGCAGSYHMGEGGITAYAVDLSLSAAGDSPATLQPGGTLIFTLSGAKHALTPDNFTVVFTPAGGGLAVKSTTATFTDQGSGTFQVTVALPASISPTQPESLNVTVSGLDAGGDSFSTNSPLAITVNPPSAISVLAPSSAHAGQTVTVAITGVYTAFVQGSTQASFGAGIYVGGAAEGALGPVTVTSATQATAQLTIDPLAAVGTRDVSVTTGSQSATAKAAFSVLAPLLPPVIQTGGPYSGTAGQSISFDGSGSTDPNGSTLTLTWNFGDGGTAAGAKVIHTYATAGTFAVTLTGTDALGASATGNTTAKVTAAPKPPTANAGGPYTGTTGTAVTFNGSGSTDPNGETLTYAWSFGDGTSGSGVSPTHAYAKAGTFTVTLTVTDTSNLTGSATATATISAPAPKAPTANAGGPYTGTTGTAVTFNGSESTDPNGETLTYAWSFGDGTNGSGVSPTHAYAKAGTFTVTLTVTDTSNLTGMATATATISAPAPKAPTANAGGPYTGTIGTAITFNGSGSSDPNGETLAYAWSFGDGTSGSGVSPTHAYAKAGTFTVTLTVTDTSNLTGTATTTATISAPASKAPTANAGGPYTGTIGTAITFNGSGSTDPNGETLTYAWSFGDGTSGTGVSPTHAYAKAGMFTVTLTVTDTSNLTGSATATATITASGNAITANPGGPYSGVVNQQITFDGSQSVDNTGGGSTAYSWSFGDGSTATGVSPAHAYATSGTFTVSLTVSDGASSATATTTATIGSTIGITITSPPPGTLTNQPTINVTGTVADSTATITVNGVQASVSSGQWTASGVALREGVNLITATATTANRGTGTATDSVTLDTTPPVVTVMSPSDGSKVFASQLTVSGMVSDLVTGTINAQNVTVTVNGVPASVSNRSFSASNVLLAPGVNTVTVVAQDKAGNTGQAVLHVNYQNQIVQQTILAVSGDGQSGVIGSTLTQPLVAQLVAANGQPVPGRPIVFNVTLSDGQVMSLPNQGQMLTLLSDANGKASVLFQLGTRSGVGINQVIATSPGFTGQARFTASSTIDQPSAIHAVLGENQRGVIGQSAPKPLQVIVTDRAGNPLLNVPVTFTVTGGGGNINGQTTLTQNTNSDGKATAILTLGLQEGTNNNTVMADYSGDTGTPVMFQVSGFSAGPVAQTSISGTVLDNSNQPIPGATARIEGTNLSAVTDAQGQFSITGVPPGTTTLLVDGSTSSNSVPYPSLSFVLQAVPGINNSLDIPIYLPTIDSESIQTVGGDQLVTLTMTGVPGVAFTVQPNSVTFPDGSHVGQMSLSQVKTDMVPMPPVNGVSAPIVWTLQPAGAKFNPPIQVTLPNMTGLKPGQVSEIYQYDHDLEQFVSSGTARVSADGSVLTSDPGFGIVKAGWGHNLPPPLPNNCTISCNEYNDCSQDVVTPQCTCRHVAKNVGGNCNGTYGSNGCKTVGTCDAFGHCTNSMNANEGGSCDDHLFCTSPDKCMNGTCVGKPTEDVKLPSSGTAGVDLTNLFGPLKGFIDTVVPGLLSFQVNASEDSVQHCCEQRQKNVTNYNDKYSLRMQGGVDIPFPPPYATTIPASVLPGGPYQVGLFGTVKGYVQAGIAVNYDSCAGNTCVSLDQNQLSIEVGVALKATVGQLLDTSAGASFTATQSLNTTDCHTMVSSYQVGGFKLSASVGVPITKTKVPVSFTFPGSPVSGQTTFSFPDRN